ncbi:hypothetical protein LN042_02835 [Kitasatospora sp. RB6PN24]|uniref:hypothetical protein n=1 Tax=Kitasatospora humi TaxID=2893891 RepID=UPI001E2ECB45|nr:hypothetical protein [Kitasatospora humi]MCC9306052.1 hypothetical protein [Kitasatospora humi]
MTSANPSREPSAMVHMTITGAPYVANVVADTVGRSFRLIAVPSPGAARDYVSAAEQPVRTRWQVDTSAPIEDAAAQQDAAADTDADPVKVELGGRADAVVKVAALIRSRFRAGPPAGISQAFEVWPESPPRAAGQA